MCQVYFVECVSKIKLIISVIFSAIYGAVCIQLTQKGMQYDISLSIEVYRQNLLFLTSSLSL